MAENYVIIRMVERDVHIGRKVTSKAQQKASNILNMKLVVILDSTTFLPVDSIGGVQAQNKHGNIIIKNTFKERGKTVIKSHLPLLKKILLKDTKFSSRYKQ